MMIDMKLTPKERADEAAEMSQEVKGPEYPWGLEINIEGESMDKLGIDPLQVGKEVTFMAVAKVSSASIHQCEDGKVEKSMRLQITGIDMQQMPKTDEQMAASMYPGKGA